MTDVPESSDVPRPSDLESLLGQFDFTPDWARGKPGVSQSAEGQAAREPRDTQNRRSPRQPRESARRNLQGVRVKPPRPNSAEPHPREEFHERGRSDNRQERPPRLPVHVDFIPDKKRLSKVVKIIRDSHRAIPLRVVAEKFMEKPAFLSVKYTLKEQEGEAETHLYVCNANGMVFTRLNDGEDYVLEHGLRATYEQETRVVPPPAGNFAFVGKHSRSGRLVGPPNWHGYQTSLEALRLEIAPHLPADAFASQIEMSKEPEAIEAWKQGVSQKIFFRVKLEVLSQEAPASAPAEESEVQTEESPENFSEDTGPAEVESASEPVAEAVAETPPPETAEPPPPDDRPFELTREQAEAEFREQYLPRLIRRTKRAIMPGYLLDKMPDRDLQSLTLFHLNREHQRPNSIVFALRPAFKHMRLHVFRFDGELMVSGIEQHPLPADLKVTREIREILDFVGAHPGCNTQEALKTVSNVTEEVPAEMVSHFRWLIEKGHLVEFFDGTLHLPHARRGEEAV